MARKLAVGICFIFIVAQSCGCIALVAGVAGGAGTAAWLSGKLVQEVSAPFDTVISAARSALKSLKLAVTKETRKDGVAQIMSTYTDGKTVWIDVHKVSSSASRLEVRVGAMGDEAAARVILDKILRYIR